MPATPDITARGDRALAAAIGLWFAAADGNRDTLARLWNALEHDDARLDVLVQYALLVDNAVRSAGEDPATYLRTLALALADR